MLFKKFFGTPKVKADEVNNVVKKEERVEEKKIIETAGGILGVILLGLLTTTVVKNTKKDVEENKSYDKVKSHSKEKKVDVYIEFEIGGYTQETRTVSYYYDSSISDENAIKKAESSAKFWQNWLIFHPSYVRGTIDKSYVKTAREDKALEDVMEKVPLRKRETVKRDLEKDKAFVSKLKNLETKKETKKEEKILLM